MSKSDRIFEQLNTKTLGDKPAEDLSVLQNPVHIQKMNVQEMETFNLINQATFRDGRPMPETMVITATSSSVSAESVTVFTPNKGEVWEIYTGQAVVTSPSGSIVHQMLMVDNNNSRNILIYYTSSTSSSLLLGQDTDWEGPFIIDSNITLQYNASGSFTNSQLLLQMSRIR